MPSYEVLFVLKRLAKPEVAKVLKRTATCIYNSKGVLFAIENLGSRSLPYAISKHGRRHREGSYFLMKFDAPVASVNVLRDEYVRDVDVIRAAIQRVKPAEEFECTLDEELKPPAYREDVKEMIETGRKKVKNVFLPKTGLEYNPFRT